MIATNMIREHMEIVSSDGTHVGTVDRVEPGNEVKVTRNDPTADGKHHYFPIDWIDHIDSQVHLKKDVDEVMSFWKK
jgi:hypothetical protein